MGALLVIARNKLWFVVGVLGILLLAAGIISALLISWQNVQPEVEIFQAEGGEEAADDLVVVDIEGAVERPGVYSLKKDSRVNEVLAEAGGYAAAADRDWVAKNVNLAMGVEDGAKIYIPFQGEEKAESEFAENQGVVIGASSAQNLVNINTASAAELDELWGIGEARAKAIMENRPYANVSELLSRNIIPSNVFEEIKDELTVY